MADNITITSGANSTPPANTVIAADDVSGVMYPVSKIALGADGAADNLVDSGQQAMAASVPVVIASDQSAVPISAASLPLPTGAATQTTLASLLTELQAKADLTETQPVSFSASENHIGEVGGNDDIVDITLSLDTSAYTLNDVLAATQEVASAMRVNAGKGLLHSITLNDKDDQGAALDLVFLRTNVSIGSENAAPSISDSDADEVLGIISVSGNDWVDLGGCRIATKAAVGLMLEAGAASTSIYIAAITRGTPTHTASGITLKLGILRS
jgi:hypothetical protein